MQSRARREVIMIHTFFFPFKKQTLLYWHNTPESVSNAVTDRYRGRTMHPLLHKTNKFLEFKQQVK